MIIMLLPVRRIGWYIPASRFCGTLYTLDGREGQRNLRVILARILLDWSGAVSHVYVVGEVFWL